ncbi:MAG: hypothetical protein IAE78_26335 [Myxococcus sp.]|nr:hypothetical protein [Myxococcus sp.]
MNTPHAQPAPVQAAPMQLTPGAHSPMQLTPGAHAPMAQPPSSGSTFKWVAIIGGSLVGLCCMCMGIGAASDAFQAAKNDVVVEPPTDSVLPVDDEPAVADTLEKLKVPPVKPPPPAPIKPALDPDGHELYDSLKFPDATEEALDELPEIPSRAELEALAKQNDENLDAPHLKRAFKAAERLRQLQQQRKANGKLTLKQRQEAQKLLEELNEL